MKKLTLILIAIIACVAYTTNTYAQSRQKIKDGVYLVSYGNTAVIEDDKNQRSISIQVIKDINTQNSRQQTYNVVCGKWSKRVVKDGLKAAIAAGIKAAAVTEGASLIINAAATAAMYVYDDVCEYYK